MILVHLSVSDKPALIDPGEIFLVEELEIETEEKKIVNFTRIYLKRVLPGAEEAPWVDVKEDVKTLAGLLAKK